MYKSMLLLIPEWLHERLKELAKERKTSLQNLVVELLQEKVEEMKDVKKEERQAKVK